MSEHVDTPGSVAGQECGGGWGESAESHTGEENLPGLLGVERLLRCLKSFKKAESPTFAN